MREVQRACDRLLGHRNARLRFDMRIADTIDANGQASADTWSVWLESDGVVLASATGCSGTGAMDTLLRQLKGEGS